MFFIVIIIYNGLVHVLSHLIFFTWFLISWSVSFFKATTEAQHGSLIFSESNSMAEMAVLSRLFWFIFYIKNYLVPTKKVSPMERHLGQVQKSMHVTFTVKNSCHFPRVSCIQRSYFSLYYSLKETKCTFT